MPNGHGGALPQERLPDPASVLTEFTLTARSGTGRAAPAAPGMGSQYRVIRTLEVDEYELPVAASEILGMRRPTRSASRENKFRGTPRRLRSSRSPTLKQKHSTTSKQLIGTLEAHNTMVNNPEHFDARTTTVSRKSGAM